MADALTTLSVGQGIGLAAGVATLALLAAPETAVAQAFEDKLELCMSCHGEKGFSSVQGVPSIAGRTLNEIVHQLRLFRSGQREHQQMVMAKRLTDQEIEQLAAYFSAKSLPR